MCGHFGVIISGKEALAMKNKLVAYFNQAMIVGELRGGDGTGILSLTDKYYTVLKRGISGLDFSNLDEVTSLTKNQDSQALLGHHRKGTCGLVSDENAHPFTYKNIILFHNGALDNLYRFKGKYAVDSESIADDISKATDIASTIKVLREIEGAYSLVWYNILEDTINFARNKDRPMYFGRTASGSLLYASEEGMLNWLAVRNGVVLSEVTSTVVGDWLSFPTDMSTKNIVIHKFKPKEVNRYSKYWDYYLEDNDGSHPVYSKGVTSKITPKAIVALSKGVNDTKSYVLPVPTKQAYRVCNNCSQDTGTFNMVHDYLLCEECSDAFMLGNI
jgi:predicted glutamine amidotransferase